MASTTVIVLIAGFMLISLVSLVFTFEASGFARFFLSAVLCWFLYLGEDWARKLLGFLSLVGALYGAAILSDMQAEFPGVVAVAVLTLFYAVAGALLLSGRIVGPHFHDPKRR